jgi:hypothetical protein
MNYDKILEHNFEYVRKNDFERLKEFAKTITQANPVTQWIPIHGSAEIGHMKFELWGKKASEDVKKFAKFIKEMYA